MKEETFKEYNWHDKEVKEALESLGIKGTIVSFYASDDHGLYLHVKTRTESKEV